MMETKKIKDLTKLMLPLVEPNGHLPENACFIQTKDKLCTYNSRIASVALASSETEYTVCANSFAKFISPKSIKEIQVDSNESEVTFSTSGKEMTLANVPLTGNSITVKRILEDSYNETKDIDFTEIPDEIQKDFIKLIKQAYLQNKGNYGLAGVYLSEHGIFSTDAIQISLLSLELPLKEIIHLGTSVVEYLIKIKEPIVKIGYKEETHAVYFCGESGIVYICQTTHLTDELKESHQNNIKKIQSMTSFPSFRVTEEMYEALLQASVAEGQGNTGFEICLNGNSGEIKSHSLTASFKGEFSWDEASTWNFRIEVDYNIFMKYVSVGTALHPIENSLNYISIENGRHIIFIPDTSISEIE